MPQGNCHMSRAIAFVMLATAVAGAQEPGPAYRLLGTVQPRSAKEITASNWSVGAETMDRDYTIYANWKQYLGPLGVKKARIQSGWAKTEQDKGKYDWAWVDEIIPDMVAQGVEPWVCLCYGNPIYPGGGGTGLGGGLPASPEAKRAWEDYIGHFVDRYQKYVDEWEIWNEPKGGRKAAPLYADLVMRTAQVIRKRQPKARILVMAGGAFDIGFVEDMLKVIGEQGKLDLVNEVTYHPYSYNPDSSYEKVAQLRQVVATFSDKITIRQGENGAPSDRGAFGALSKYDWNERFQAKWALRRLLGDLGHDIPTSYFAICDMAYRIRAKGGDSDLRDDASKLKLLINRKGLLHINDDRTVDHVKEAYKAVQNITAIFDNTLRRIDGYDCAVTGGSDKGAFATFGYRKPNGKQVVTLWRSSDRPGEREETEQVTLTIAKGDFDDPVWVEMMTGKVYQIPKSSWTKSGSQYTFRNVPVADAPVLVADRSAIVLVK